MSKCRKFGSKSRKYKLEFWSKRRKYGSKSRTLQDIRSNALRDLIKILKKSKKKMFHSKTARGDFYYFAQIVRYFYQNVRF